MRLFSKRMNSIPNAWKIEVRTKRERAPNNANTDHRQPPMLRAKTAIYSGNKKSLCLTFAKHL